MPVLANSAISQDAYQAESEKIRERFEQSHNGQAAIRERSNLTDSFISELWNQVSPGTPDRICVAALGGYGRRALFPCSDVDVLFLHDSALSEDAQKRVIPRDFSSSLGPAPPRRRHHPFPGGVRQAAPRQSRIQHFPAGLPLHLRRRRPV